MIAVSALLKEHLKGLRLTKFIKIMEEKMYQSNILPKVTLTC